MSRTLFTNISQLVTLAGPDRPRIGPEMHELGIISDGALVVSDGSFEWVGRRVDAPSNLPEFDCGGRVVLPGFVDAHTHPVFAGNRVDEYEKRSKGATYEEIAATGGGIQSTVAKTREASEDQLFHQSERYVEWFYRSGTTTIEAKSGYGLTVEDELKILRVIRRLDAKHALRYVPTFLGAHAVPVGSTKADYVECVLNEMIPQVCQANLAEYCDIFCEANYFDLPNARRILGHAKAAGLGLRVHADQLTNCGGAVLAAELGATTADHLEQTDSEGIRALCAAGIQPVLLPGSVFALGLKTYPKAREMLDGGLAVVLATDFNPGSSPIASMPFILSLASTQMKMSPAEAVSAATINAAASLNRASEIGSIAIGKKADFAIHDCTDYREIAYFVGSNLTKRVFIGGRQVLNETETELRNL